MKIHKKILWITETAIMLALLITLQWVGKVTIPVQLTMQLVTGPCVNAVLVLTVLMVGMSSGIVVALISPVFAFLLGIAPNLITVPAIMLGNVCYVVLFRLITGGQTKPLWKNAVALAAASVVKFTVLYLIVVKLICGPWAPNLLGKFLPGMEKPLLAPPMLAANALPLMFSWPQLVTALVGGALALAIWPLIKKALKR